MSTSIDELTSHVAASGYRTKFVFQTFNDNLKNFPEAASELIRSKEIFEDRESSISLEKLSPGDTIIFNRDFDQCMVETGNGQVSIYDLRMRSSFSCMEAGSTHIVHITKVTDEHIEFVPVNGKYEYKPYKLIKNDYYDEISHYIVRTVGKDHYLADELEFMHTYNKEIDEIVETASVRFEKIAEIAEQVYPGMTDMRMISEDNPDMVDSRYSDYPAVLIVKFPELEVTNRRNERHKITDIYVFFPISHIGELGRSIEGIRGKLEVKEAHTGYTHSHLGGNMETIGGFCTGSGDFATNISILRSEYDLELWEVTLTQLKYYLEWESISGGPFKRIQKPIAGKQGKGHHISSRSCDVMMKAMRKHAPSEILDNSLQMEIHDNGDGTSDVSIRGWRDVAEWILECEGLKEEVSSELVRQSVIYVNTEGAQISEMKLREARKLLESFGDYNPWSLQLRFRGELYQQEIFLDESLYEESYTDTIPMVNPYLKHKIEQKVLSNFMSGIASEININTQTEQYNEHRKQIKTFPKRILAGTTVF